jgi:hypothetical protein
MRALIIAALLIFAGCVTIEPDPPPDFYDRNGVACWRFTDMIWCEDGYESNEDTT